MTNADDSILKATTINSDTSVGLIKLARHDDLEARPCVSFWPNLTN